MIYTREMQIIRRIVNPYVNVEVVFSEQNCIKPKGSYIAIYFIDQNPIGRTKKTVDDNGTIKYTQNYDLLICFDFIGDRAIELANKVANIWPLEAVQEQLIKNKIAWRKNAPIKNTSSIYEERYTPKVSFDSYFYVKNDEYEQQYTIEKVKFNGIN